MTKQEIVELLDQAERNIVPGGLAGDVQIPLLQAQVEIARLQLELAYGDSE